MRLIAAAGALLALACAPRPTQTEEPHGDPLAETAADVLYERGSASAQSGDLVRAEQYLAAAIKKGYPAARALPVLVDVCVRGNRFDTALHYARPHLEQNPGNWRLRYLVATLYNAVDRTQEAKTELARVLRQAPKAADAHYTLATILLDENRRDEAAEHLEAYLRLVPDGAMAIEARDMLTTSRAHSGATRDDRDAGAAEGGEHEPEPTGEGEPSSPPADEDAIP